MSFPGFGLEGVKGIGGGTISKESEYNYRRAHELLKNAKRKRPFRSSSRPSRTPNNLDACVALSSTMPTPDAQIGFLTTSEAIGRTHLKRFLGPDCFELTSRQGAPNFWGILATRPYMRLLSMLTRTYISSQRWQEAAATNIEILRLCESDNLGHQGWMGPLLLHAGRPVDALYFARAWLESGGPPRGSEVDFAPPNRAAMTPEELEDVTNPFMNLQTIYSAALAAFTVDGDSELARQYLHLAVSKFPAVLIKVLGKFKERVDVDTHATRTINGLEDARDHLWLAQGLWSQPGPWDWISNDPVVKDHVFRPCSDPSCKKRKSALRSGRSARGDWYCSRACQKAHWCDHKEECKQRQRLANVDLTGLVW
ncbi:hypothetical protein FB45DRAFT_948030 [Roridomyces roridus]|uniref:MYND-type domain-containing protein n=1 Tax=Roridomyces roridus TaxID=1738132 RepID=A0AAD7B236_9AGAR|nr:hypothetical protein FB45DRAFT_948030 [Roridomyces roridus]